MHKRFYSGAAKPATIAVGFDDVQTGDWIYHSGRFPSAERVLAKLPHGIVTGSTTRHGFTRDMFRGLVTIVDRSVAAEKAAQWEEDFAIR